MSVAEIVTLVGQGCSMHTSRHIQTPYGEYEREGTELRLSQQTRRAVIAVLAGVASADDPGLQDSAK